MVHCKCDKTCTSQLDYKTPKKNSFWRYTQDGGKKQPYSRRTAMDNRKAIWIPDFNVLIHEIWLVLTHQQTGGSKQAELGQEFIDIVK